MYWCCVVGLVLFGLCCWFDFVVLDLLCCFGGHWLVVWMLVWFSLIVLV